MEVELRAVTRAIPPKLEDCEAQAEERRCEMKSHEAKDGPASSNNEQQ